MLKVEGSGSNNPFDMPQMGFVPELTMTGYLGPLSAA